jgi:heme/copper-type cytochrome/quinol oxidase subunit 1
VSRRWFWPLVALAIVTAAVGAAFLGFAVANRNYAEPRVTPAGWTAYVPLKASENEACFTCTEPLPWLVIGGVLVIVALVPLLLAARRR